MGDELGTVHQWGGDDGPAAGSHPAGGAQGFAGMAPLSHGENCPHTGKAPCSRAGSVRLHPLSGPSGPAHRELGRGPLSGCRQMPGRFPFIRGSPLHSDSTLTRLGRGCACTGADTRPGSGCAVAGVGTHSGGGCAVAGVGTHSGGRCAVAGVGSSLCPGRLHPTDGLLHRPSHLLQHSRNTGPRLHRADSPLLRVGQRQGKIAPQRPPSDPALVPSSGHTAHPVQLFGHLLHPPVRVIRTGGHCPTRREGASTRTAGNVGQLPLCPPRFLTFRLRLAAAVGPWLREMARST